MSWIAGTQPSPARVQPQLASWADSLAELAQLLPELELRTDPESLTHYGRDWTRVYAPAPAVIAFPRTQEQVAKLLAFCDARRLPVVPSGGRTGLAGGAVAARGELVLSFERMNRIGPIDTRALTVRVEAGAITEAVHQATAPFGLTWPVDFASKGSSHVGGNIATNAGGVRVIRYGMTRNWVLGLEVVTARGECLVLNGSLEKNNTGLDLRQLFIGTEGTLGVVTAATLKLARLPGACDVYFFALDGMAATLALFERARTGPFELTAFEMLTHNCLEAVLELRGLRAPFETRSPCYVLMEVERGTTGDSASPEREAAQDAWLNALFAEGAVLDGVRAQSPTEARTLWALREGVAEAIVHRGQPHKNDIAVPIAELEAFTQAMTELFAARERGQRPYEVYVFGHIGDGNLHVNTLRPRTEDAAAFVRQMHDLDQALFDLVKQHHGSISAEHGIGLLKKDALPFSRSPEEIHYLREMKRALDPHGILNPGKILDVAVE